MPREDQATLAAHTLTVQYLNFVLAAVLLFAFFKIMTAASGRPTIVDDSPRLFVDRVSSTICFD